MKKTIFFNANAHLRFLLHTHLQMYKNAHSGTSCMIHKKKTTKKIHSGIQTQTEQGGNGRMEEEEMRLIGGDLKWKQRSDDQKQKPDRKRKRQSHDADVWRQKCGW